MRELETGAFWNCESLSGIDLPGSLTYLGGNAFDHCTGLTNVTIPEGITTLPIYVFAECFNLESVTIPKSVVSIRDEAFYDCPADLVICGYKGTAAESFAAEKGFGFKALD